MADEKKNSSPFSNFRSSALRTKTIVTLTSNADGQKDALVRRLGVLDLLLLGIGASIGAGIFVVTGTVARDAGPENWSIALKSLPLASQENRSALEF